MVDSRRRQMPVLLNHPTPLTPITSVPFLDTYIPTWGPFGDRPAVAISDPYFLARPSQWSIDHPGNFAFWYGSHSRRWHRGPIAGKTVGWLSSVGEGLIHVPR
ncbi:hypothetical protein Salmi_Mp044 (mitochondrion) [Salvia miltiorrhiza]|uniref:Uncharacterized protein n=1 Tax=Salvia miltiorrhiza TaxID=226208 RepID=V9P4R5_SALMI|nr:hypothetical protein Salmi_Mp044 [Salvia miltiorrhiza]AGU16575.1 hypothetical protein Salmi_Mp044 [Salvia miltiorrhiza]